VLPYLKLQTNEDSEALRDKIRQKVANLEGPSIYLPDIKLIRWKMVHFKLAKLFGVYHSLEKGEKLKIVY